ncbi:MAG TPA: PP2C family protein-serine/threonine phosphatase, partial [Candidatus Baltobacteraceae bacterium]|nr:PP2C family protein-serine/threonine phosphatase [Candidatus Baltobacteraceae bacterium]
MAERRRAPRVPLTRAKIGTIDSDASALDRAVAADVVLRHLFVPPAQPVAGIRYAAYYRFAEKHSGGDIIDVYRCTEGDVNFSLTDISGKGVSAALHAGLVKYGIRAYATQQHRPSSVLRWLNRFYKENDAFEGSDSFASVFFGRYTIRTRTLSYASAGHDGVFMLSRNAGTIVPLNPSGPVVGVFEDQEDLYGDDTIQAEPGDTLLAVSDGVTEARREGELFGMERLTEAAIRLRERSLEDLACGIAREATQFARN